MLPANETILALAAKYPKAFFLLESRRKPLAKGIADTLLAAAPPDEHPAILFALKVYVANVRYLGACHVDAPRIGLDGEVAGHVTAKEARFAARRHAQLSARILARRRSRKQPRARAGALTLAGLKAAAMARKTQITKQERNAA
jgi:sRNA-binding protein